MTLINMFVLAIALAMDAFAVSVAAGVNLKNISKRQIFRLSWHFGFFQALMPIIGWNLGFNIRFRIEYYDHWIAFGILLLIGGKMIKDSFGNKDHNNESINKDPTKGLSLIMLSIATSIDALAVGLSMAMLGVSIFKPSLIIGIIALLFTSLGMYIGSKIVSASNFSRYAELTGGIVLIAIGLNILREHILI